MYSVQLPQSLHCTIVTFYKNGFSDASEIPADDDATFFQQQKARLLDAHPNLTTEEVESIIKLQEQLADNIFDIWITKRNKKTA